MHFKHTTAKDPYLGSTIGKSKRLVGRGRGRLKKRNRRSVISNTTRTKAAYHCYTLPKKKGKALTIERGRRGRGVGRIRRRMKDRDGDVERQLGKAGDEGNKGKEGGV